MPIFRRQRKIGKVRIVPEKESCSDAWLFLYVEMENKYVTTMRESSMSLIGGRIKAVDTRTDHLCECGH